MENTRTYNLSLRNIIFLYLQFHLLVDLINGFVLNVVDLGEALSFAQLTRLGIFLLLNIYLLREKYSKNIYLILVYLVFGIYIILFFLINDGALRPIVSELSMVVKLSSYFILVFFAKELQEDELRKIVNTNFIIFCGSILLAYFLGVGNDGYRGIEASKGFFHANNATSIVGMCFVLYYFKIDQDFRKLTLLSVVLFFTGSKVFLFIVLVFAYIFFKGFMKSFEYLKASIIFYVGVVISVGMVGVSFFQEFFWENRYRTRVIGAFYNSAKAGLTDSDQNIILKLYSYISTSRALNSKIAIEYLMTNKTNLLFGVGSYFTKYKIFGKLEAIETDFTDMLVMYGLLGLTIYLFFHFRMIYYSSSNGRMVAIFVLVYSVVAGHYIYNPMSYTLAACIIGYFLHHNNFTGNQMESTSPLSS